MIDERYRPEFRRQWAYPRRCLMVIGFNPSRASSHFDDATTRTIRRIAERHGYTEFCLGNVFDLRATDPKALRIMTIPWRSPDWHPALVAMAARCVDIMVAWGSLPRTFKAVGAALETLGIAEATIAHYTGASPRVLCIGTTKHGDPRHPLYTRNDARLVPWDSP